MTDVNQDVPANWIGGHSFKLVPQTLCAQIQQVLVPPCLLLLPPWLYLVTPSCSLVPHESGQASPWPGNHLVPRMEEYPVCVHIATSPGSKVPGLVFSTSQVLHGDSKCLSEELQDAGSGPGSAMDLQIGHGTSQVFPVRGRRKGQHVIPWYPQLLDGQFA